MASTKSEEEKINELIWGNLESEIIETKFSLYVASEVIKSAKVYPVKLLVGFLDFIHYKCGLEPKLGGNEKSEFGAIDGDFADRSSWVEFLGLVAEGVLEDPYFFRQFTDQNGDNYEVFILMDTFSLFECGMIMNKTRLEGDAKFSSAEISREFHVDEKRLPRMLSYFKYLHDVGRTRTHTLVLRPTKLAEMLYWLDSELLTLTNYPKQVVRTEEWEDAKDTRFGRWDMLSEGLWNLETCNEENFQELLKARSIETPNVQVLTLYEYVRGKLTPEAVTEWKRIRDSYIAECKKVLKDSISGLAEEELGCAKTTLAKARKAIEEGEYAESVRQSCKALEEVMNAMIEERMNLNDEITKVTTENPDLRKYREGLHFIRTTRNKLSHSSGVNECDVADAEFALEKMDQFLIGIADSLSNP